VKKTLVSLGAVVSAGLPLLVSAAATFRSTYLDSLIEGGIVIFRRLVIFLISLAVVWFIWNVVRYAMSSDEDGKEKAKSQMIHGIIAIAVMVSIWGIVAILRYAFGTDQGNAIPNDIYNMIPG
jgi:hypothetical protein